MAAITCEEWLDPGVTFWAGAVAYECLERARNGAVIARRRSDGQLVEMQLELLEDLRFRLATTESLVPTAD